MLPFISASLCLELAPLPKQDSTDLLYTANMIEIIINIFIILVLKIDE